MKKKGRVSMKYVEVPIFDDMLLEFKEYLIERENAASTIEKYMRDVKKFLNYMGEKEVFTKEDLLNYKAWLVENYSINSVNSMLVALNQFLTSINLGRMKLKRLRQQKQMLFQKGNELTKEEYQRLLCAAQDQKKSQLVMMMETICSTGIRVSELKFFCVENVKSEIVKVWNKGKYRLVILPKNLQKKLGIYAKKRKIRKGMIFQTRNGKEKNRSNIWKEMKQLAQKADVEPQKIFPHNLRHLFARTYYKVTKNLVNLADILGHNHLEVTRIYASDGIEEWRREIDKLNLLQE